MLSSEKKLNLPVTRPFPVTIILGLGLILTVARVWEVWALFQQMSFAQSLGIDLRWRLGSALIWIGLWVWLTVALWRNNPFAYRFIPGFLLLHTLYQAGWRVATLAQPATWLIYLVVGLVLTIVSYIFLKRHQPAVGHQTKPAEVT